ncbi:unnamed protein product [Effrenium voratum]|nr:unnamed protein product [Effrenium voratum]
MENSSERTVNSFSLTFVQATAEESFLESRRGVMIRAIFWSSLVLIFLMLVNCAYLVLAVLAGDLEAPGLRSVLLHRAFICGIMLFMLSLAAGFGCRPCCHFPTWKIESTAAALLAIFMPAVVFIDGHYMLKLYAVDGIYLRRDDGICLDYASDTRLMLTWIAMLTCTHFFMNLRWYTLLPCQISGLLSYMFCAALGSPEGVLLVMNLALFAGITALASLAKRGLEHHERHSMLQLISERVRRFESDFKLEQAQSMSVASPSSASMRQREIDARSMAP